jgi:MFS family permease
MSSQAITPFIAGLIMDKWGNKYMMLYAALSIALAVALMFFVKHGDAKPAANKADNVENAETA